MNNFCGDNLENRWKSEEKDPIVPAFNVEPGIKIDFPDSCNELDIFKCFLPEELIEEMRAMEKLLGKNGTVAPNRMSDLFGKDCKLFLDNWYTTEKLFRYLEENGTAACGTARTNQLQLPKSFKKKPLQKRQYRFLRDENMLVVRFHDKKTQIFLIHYTFNGGSCEWKIKTEGKNVAIN